MDVMAIARINGQMILWALRRSGGDIESLVTTKTSLDKIQSWISGEGFPSESDAKALAERIGLAYPMLYMQNVPPDEPIKVPDRRTVDGHPLRNPSPNLLAILDKTKARQQWYRSELPETAKGLTFVARFSLHTSPKVIAEDMRKTLGVDAETRARSSDYEDFLKSLISKAESIGILVMRSALAGHATRRILSVKEFRGFVLIDPLAPIIFINDNDAKAAQIFTFAHELAHIWIGAAGVSDRKPEDKGSSTNEVEVLCDRIAAEFLVPEQEFSSFWSSPRSLNQNMSAASRHFRVSTLVVLRRARDLNRITSETFYSSVEEQYEAYKLHEANKKRREDRKKKKGGNFWASFELRNGAKFNAAVAESIRRQRLTYAEAGALFWITPLSAARYMNRLSAAR